MIEEKEQQVASAKEQLEFLIRMHHTDVRENLGDTDPRNLHNMVYNIAWEIYHAMRNEGKIDKNPRGKIKIVLADLSDKNGPTYYDFLYGLMEKTRLITNDGYLTKDAVIFYDGLLKENYYVNDDLL